jgi:hypothetical protein
MKDLWEIKNFEVAPGSNLSDVIKSAITIAQANHCIVKFKFNETELRVSWTSGYEEIIDEYDRWCKQQSASKMQEDFNKDVSYYMRELINIFSAISRDLGKIVNEYNRFRM